MFKITILNISVPLSLFFFVLILIIDSILQYSWIKNSTISKKYNKLFHFQLNSKSGEQMIRTEGFSDPSGTAYRYYSFCALA